MELQILGHAKLTEGVTKWSPQFGSVERSEPKASSQFGSAERGEAKRSQQFDFVERGETELWEENVEKIKKVDYSKPCLLISTEDVFLGDSGNYKETDLPNPRNYYGLTKLIAEQLILTMCPISLVVRVSFVEDKWLHPVAYTDQHTSADYIDVVIKQLSWVINRYNEILEYLNKKGLQRILHLGTERKSMYDLIIQRNPEVWPGRRKEGKPLDTSLDTSLYKRIRLVIL